MTWIGEFKAGIHIMETSCFSPVACLLWMVLAFTASSVYANASVHLPLYPYGLDAGDEEAALGAPQEIDTGFKLHYYGQTFTKIYIMTDGLVSFDQSVRYNEVADWRKGVPNLALDRPFIAPFHYNGYVPIDPDTYQGKIYYKVTKASDPWDQAKTAFLRELDAYMTDAVVGLKQFKSRFALQITWENVTYYGCTENCETNTFQFVLVACDSLTFTIFNYYRMEIPYDGHQLAGLNGGYGRGWTDVIHCDTACVKRNKPGIDRIASLTNRSGSDVQGRYIMEVDGDIIIRGGCIPAGLKAGRVEVFPQETGMLGGQMLSVSGECHPKGSRIFCRFAKDDNFVSQGVMETGMKGRCPVPLLTTRGEISLEMSATRESWKHSTTITIILPSRLNSELTLSTEEAQALLAKDPSGNLKIAWDPRNLTSRPRATVDITVIGYRELYHQNQIEWSPLVKIGENIANRDGMHRFDPAQYRCQHDCERFEIGMLEIKLNDRYVDTDTKYVALRYGPVPLGWYINSAMTAAYGSDWPVEMCQAWDTKDKQSEDWLDHLLPCPCTLTQAMADWGRWQPDVSCNLFTGSVCAYHVGAKHCVRSVHPSPDGAGNQCCYEYDGTLRYAADTFEGSTPDRSHDWGAAPYSMPRHMPSFSHWLDDVVTFYYCCLWTEPVKGAPCKHYMDRRSTRDCVAYVPPAAATVYGDPHITTFDGTTFYFGGAGDFWLLKSDTINIQGKFKEANNDVLQLSSGQLKPTILRSVVMWTPDSDMVAVSLAPLDGAVQRRLDVTVNGYRRFFEKRGMTWQDFTGVSIVNNEATATSDADKYHSNFTVLFKCGAGVQIAERHGLLHVIVLLPPNGQHDTKGLLGSWDSDASNDYTTNIGTVVPMSASQNDVYNQFSLSWAVQHDDSKFHFPTTAVTNKQPYFGIPEDVSYRADMTPPSQADVRALCGDSQVCTRDYFLTSDSRVANASKLTEETFHVLQHAHMPVASCGLLDIPMAVKKPTHYTLGSVVNVTACRPDETPVLGSGPFVYTCAIPQSGAAAMWSPAPDRSLCGFQEDGDTKEASDTGLIVGIVVACVVVIIFIIIVVVVALRRRPTGRERKPVPAKRSKHRNDEETETGGMFLKCHAEDREDVRMPEVQKRLDTSEEV